ncbi:MAG: acetate--CoA ligase family protein, partial [Propionivibrio sp.]
MSIRNLDQLFAPASIAVFGASLRPARVGTIVWKNILHGGFRGAIYPVNPKYRELEGTRVFARTADLPAAPELAVICTPPATVPGLIAELGALGTRAALMLTAGLSPRQQEAMLRAARPHLLRILGPACVGMLSPPIGLNASCAHTDALAGGLAFVSQSGALVTAMLDWARERAIGFSHFVSLGESADVDVGDVLDYLASDAQTRAVILYIESIASARKFMSAARAAARNKPVIVVKAGRSEADPVYDAAISRAGMLRVDTLQDLFLAAETLTRLRNNRSDELTILTNGGGAGVMAADAAARSNLQLAAPSAALVQRLDAVLPANWSRGNPVNIGGDMPVQRYVDALEILGDDLASGAILFMHAPSALVPSEEIAHALVPIAQRFAPRIMACWLGEAAVAKARLAFRDAGIAGYATPDEAVRAFSLLVTYRRNQAQLMRAPATQAATPWALAGANHRVAIQELLQRVLAEGREILTQPEVKTVLDAYGIPVTLTRHVGPHPAEAATAAAAIGLPVVLKIRSTDIAHKSASGGVVLHLDSAPEVREAAQAMLARARKANPDARIDGFTVQAMV